MNNTSADKFPNLIQLWKNKNICQIIEQLLVLYSAHKSSELLSVVHIILDSFDEKLNFLEIQKQSNNVAKELRPFKLLFYFIILQKVRKLKFTNLLFNFFFFIKRSYESWKYNFKKHFFINIFEIGTRWIRQDEILTFNFC